VVPQCRRVDAPVRRPGGTRPAARWAGVLTTEIPSTPASGGPGSERFRRARSRQITRRTVCGGFAAHASPWPVTRPGHVD